MKSNPERTAWTILLTAFSTFCILCATIPTSLYWYITNATTPFMPEVTSVRGTVLLGDPQVELSASLVDGTTKRIEELFTVATDDTSQAILTFADDSSVTMYSNTRLILRQSQEPRINIFSYKPSLIQIEVERGRIRATTSRDREDLNFNIDTPHATITLGQGSYSIDVNERETQLTNRLGESSLTDQQQHAVTLRQGQRAVAGLAEPVAGPLPSAQNLLRNTDFTPAFAEIWQIYDEEPIQGVTTIATVENFQERNVLVLKSEGRDNVHTETGVIQEVNKDVRDFQSLRVFAEVRLVEQSLPGGGQLGSEFPIMLHVAYKDANNNDRNWLHGFYYTPPPENYILYNQPDNSSERIAQYIWYPYESVNLLATLGPAKPVFIKSIRIYASGWIYEAMVANISLLAEE
jgi:hypothetical protein